MGCEQSTQVFHQWESCWLSGRRDALYRDTEGVAVAVFENVELCAKDHCVHAQVGRLRVQVGAHARCFEVATGATRARECLQRHCRGVRCIWEGEIVVQSLDGM